MAAGLGFKTFSTGEVLTAANVNGYLMQGILVFATAAARDAAITSPQEGQACYLKDTNGVLTYSGSAWVSLGGGATGLTLVAIQSTVKTDTFTTTSSSFVDVTGLSVNITPTSASSKILVLFQINGSQEVGVARAAVKLLRDSTVIDAGAAASNRTPALGGFSSIDQSIPSAPVSGSIYDSPATTSSITYKIQLAATAGGGTAYINRTQQDSDTTSQIRMASTITVLEIL